MKLVIVFCALTALLSLSAGARDRPSSSIKDEPTNAPWFCHDLDCPPYTVEETLDGGIELRSYEAGMWVSTNVTDMSFSVAMTTGFYRLFKYISGANKEEMKIAMTAPVRNRIYPSDGPFCKSSFTISFYVPFSLQDSPPEPSDELVFLECKAAEMYYATSFAGFASEKTVVEKAKETVDMLTSLEREFDASMYVYAGYDPPFRLLFRHNEVHIPAIMAPEPSTVDK